MRTRLVIWSRRLQRCVIEASTSCWSHQVQSPLGCFGWAGLPDRTNCIACRSRPLLVNLVSLRVMKRGLTISRLLRARYCLPMRILPIALDISMREAH